MEEKKLFLLDAFALIYRAYFALNNNTHFNPVNSKGVNTAAILGFTNTLVELLNKEKPSHIAVVFDSPSVTLRQVEFSAYKANREEMPEDIRSAIPFIKEIIQAFKIPILLSEGYEADDIIGTLAKKAEQKGYTTYMMTPDKDFGQLVSDKIFIYKPAKAGSGPEIMGVKEVCDKYGIQNPEQLIDILGMWGDKVDNIPGIPGVGEKTAAKLIQEYGSMENMYEHLDDLKGKLKENVTVNKEQAFMSKSLARIVTDVPIEFEDDKLIMEEMDREKLHQLFSELEFRTLSKRILEKEISSSNNQKGQTSLFPEDSGESNQKNELNDKQPFIKEYESAETLKHEYTGLQGENGMMKLMEVLTKANEICFDTETTGLDPLTAELIGMSFSITKGKAYYIEVPGNQDKVSEFILPLKRIFSDETKTIIAQNLKFDLKVLHKYGITIEAKTFDTMIAHYLLHPDDRHNMDYLAEDFLNYRTISIESLIGKKGKNQGNMRDVPFDKITEYAAEDADVTLQLKQVFEQKLKNEGLNELFYDIEMPLVEVLAQMEEEGIKLDVETLRVFSKDLGTDLDRIENEIYTMAGTKFNMDSPKQLGQILFDVLKITDKIPKTKTGQYSTNEDVLVKLKNEHNIIDKVLSYRTLKKLKSTYADALPEEVNPITGKIHTTFSQTIAATGRLSSIGPNLQNIPIKTERGREIRKAFVPRDKDYSLLAADYSQIELRIIAALSDDRSMIEAFRNNEDIHTATAAKIFNVSVEKVDREMRTKAKSVNFGIIYGQSSFGLSQNINVSRTEAKEIIDAYFSQYPNIKKYMEQNIDKARKNGFVETIMHRKRYLKDINSSNAIVRGAAERNAINAPIQGSAADIIKIAMINIHKALKKGNFKSRMLLQVHDELVFDAHNAELNELKPMIRYNMENAVSLNVPLTVEMNNAENWLDAH